MLDQTLFPFIDAAMCVILLLALIAMPLLIPVPAIDRALRFVRNRLGKAGGASSKRN
ncbi:MAG: hypothetical protein ACT4PZ_06400 [Panacagrimonas sp.]